MPRYRYLEALYCIARHWQTGRCGCDVPVAARRVAARPDALVRLLRSLRGVGLHHACPHPGVLFTGALSRVAPSPTSPPMARSRSSDKASARERSSIRASGMNEPLSLAPRVARMHGFAVGEGSGRGITRHPPVRAMISGIREPTLELLPEENRRAGQPPRTPGPLTPRRWRDGGGKSSCPAAPQRTPPAAGTDGIRTRTGPAARRCACPGR